MCYFIVSSVALMCGASFICWCGKVAGDHCSNVPRIMHDCYVQSPLFMRVLT